MLNVLAQAVPVFDWTNFGVTAIQAIVPVVTTLAIWAGRALLVKTPRVVIPIVAVMLAAGLGLVVASLSGGGSGREAAARRAPDGGRYVGAGPGSGRGLRLGRHLQSFCRRPAGRRERL